MVLDSWSGDVFHSWGQYCRDCKRVSNVRWSVSASRLHTSYENADGHVKLYRFCAACAIEAPGEGKLLNSF